MTDTTKRVLVVDDDPIVVTGISEILRSASDIEVVGTCSDGDQLPDAIARLHPDVILCDVRMSRMDGITALTKFKDSGPPFLMITAFDDGDAVLKAIAAGAAGFVLKGEEPERIKDAVRHVHAGEATLSPRAAKYLTDWAQATMTDQVRSDAQARVAELTEREREYAVQVLDGSTDAQIAARLFVAETTVKSTLLSVRTKLGARNRIHLAATLAYAGVVHHHP